MSSTLRLLPSFTKLICVFARVMAEAAMYLRQKSLCVYQYLGDWLMKGSLEQCAPEQMKILFILANLGLAVQQLKYWVNPALECVHTLRPELFKTFPVKLKFVETKICHADFIKILWRRFWDTWFAKLGWPRKRKPNNLPFGLPSTHQNQTLELKKCFKFLFLLCRQWRQELKL